MTHKVLSYDIGGTKVAVGVVTSRGRILEEIRVPVQLEQGKTAVISRLVELGRQMIRQHKDIKWVGIASAGPLNPITGELLDPTNFVSSKGSWGKVPLAKIMTQELKRPAYLDNDAAAAMLAERWIGAAKKYKNSMILTLGTGLGTGMICNGELVRAGRNLHPEAGHMIIRFNDPTAPCGCGNFGCAKAYLSGKNFTRRTQLRFANPNLSSKDIVNLARKQDPLALAAFEEYAEIMAVTIHNFVRLYSPELIVFAGSFAAAADLFIPSTRKYLEVYLARERKGIDLMPKLEVSKLNNSSGIIGGAYIALLRKNLI